MKRVLIAVDGTEESNDAARFAHVLLGSDVEYLVLTVADAGAFLSGAMPIADPMLAGGGGYVDPDTAREAMDSAFSQAEHDAVEVVLEVAEHAEAIVEAGPPADTICRVAEARKVDLIVIGSHERGWFSKLITPSVRNHVLDHAPCPVLVVR